MRAWKILRGASDASTLKATGARVCASAAKESEKKISRNVRALFMFNSRAL
jgi:hypothetical protein